MNTLFINLGILTLCVIGSFGEMYSNNSISIQDIEAMEITTTEKPKPLMGCLGPNHQIVDWFVAYKYPRVKKAVYIPENHQYGNEANGSGYNFAYITSETVAGLMWEPSLYSFTNINYNNEIERSIIGKTLLQRGVGKLEHRTYNDGKNKDNKQKAHAKGTVWKTSDGSGFWIIHSAPNFNPTPNQPLMYPDPPSKFGQIFFCLSFSSVDSYQKITDHLQYIDAEYVSVSNTEQELDLKKFTTESKNNGILRFDFEGNNKIPYKLFSKPQSSVGDIYDYANNVLHPGQVINPFAVVAWRTRVHTTNDVREITMSLPPTSLNPSVIIRWGTLTSCFLQNTKSKDHSKWSISLIYNGHVCFGDLNRNGNPKEDIYHKRSGGLLCFQNENLRNAFRSIISL